MEIPKGYCQCGCGKLAPIARQSEKSRGYIKGEPHKFLPGHNHKGQVRENSSAWKGGKVSAQGPRKSYIRVLMPEHPRANQAGYVLEHILIVEKAMGKPLPPGAVVHHHNEDGTDNETSGNLVACQDDAYHKLLHRRLRALKACGHASWKRCKFCEKWDDPAKMYVGKNEQAHHRACMNIHAQNRRKP